MTGRSAQSLTAARRLDSSRRRQRVLNALGQLGADGQEISVSAVARAAGVDRSFLYRHHDLVAQIHRLRQNRSTRSKPRLPSGLRATNESPHARAEALRAEIERLTEENRWLRQQAETLLGERRATPHQPDSRP